MSIMIRPLPAKRLIPEILVAGLLVCLIACGIKPVMVGSVTPDVTNAIYDCLQHKVTGLGYLVIDDERLSGFLVADRKTAGGLSQEIFGRSYTDWLKIWVDRPDSVPRKVRVAVSRFKETKVPPNVSALRASEKDFADADSLLSACASGAITKK